MSVPTDPLVPHRDGATARFPRLAGPSTRTGK
ncbi:hypothetical protein EDD29_3625 [Actinocorallia herbida]|uniref:Uncharacterized protein n=1 Tax=Actinocorallia herbida TaxID=58109 RepID=A0A3N1CXQ4_9ACTN|nr:hypothetical protein EDD29_3625 [Actinocorallia herbida]